jgi:uncharacterized glyoxalase superfamily metalloenzyme YdcJ
MDMASNDFSSQDELRTTFALSMSAMYKTEVPLYGDLIDIVRTVNQKIIAENSQWHEEQERLDLERHGAIRLGSSEELCNVRRLFKLFGLHPVGYYDLSVAGLPMHATAFRSLCRKSLAKNPFRVFTTVLRPELLADETRSLAASLVQKRQLFSPQLLELVSLEESQGGLTAKQGEQLVAEAMEIFRWQSVATASKEEYEKLQADHPIIADVACFASAHINHLTPRTLDIDAAQNLMKSRGLSVKSRVEGPPLRKVPILLRQTSFLALQEKVQYPSDTKLVDGFHKARFGEIEQRGAAVTLRGRKLYDTLLARAMSEAQAVGASPNATDEILASVFEDYPDSFAELLEQGLVFCTYKIKKRTQCTSPASVEDLLSQGVLEAVPQTYEDFLPFSAAGIFQSNLGEKAAQQKIQPAGDQEGFEKALGATVSNADVWYLRAQQQSLDACAQALGIQIWSEC